MEDAQILTIRVDGFGVESNYIFVFFENFAGEYQIPVDRPDAEEMLIKVFRAYKEKSIVKIELAGNQLVSINNVEETEKNK